jgi:hypothetical protein
MPTVAESSQGQGQLTPALEAGLNSLSRDQTIVFKKYTKTILPIDGFVFWLATSQTQKVKGSLHYSVQHRQEQDQTIDLNFVTLSTLKQIKPFNNIGPNEIWIGTIDNIRFSFADQGDNYKQSGVYHYRGQAINPAMASQIIDNPGSFDASQLIVSNSLPIWMASAFQINNTTVPVYPSMLVADNLTPPYIAVHIEPGSTAGLHFAKYDAQYSQAQLARESVVMTLYGLGNNDAMDFMDYLTQYSLNDVFGFSSIPVIRDQKRTQNELSILGMKKTIEFEVNYYQYRARNIAGQLIQSAVVACYDSAAVIVTKSVKSGAIFGRMPLNQETFGGIKIS